MQDVTLVIPAKFESESLPRVLSEIESIEAKKIIVIPKDDFTTLNSIKDYNHKIILQTLKHLPQMILQRHLQPSKYFYYL